VDFLLYGQQGENRGGIGGGDNYWNIYCTITIDKVTKRFAKSLIMK